MSDVQKLPNDFDIELFLLGSKIRYCEIDGSTLITITEFSDGIVVHESMSFDKIVTTKYDKPMNIKTREIIRHDVEPTLEIRFLQDRFLIE